MIRRWLSEMREGAKVLASRDFWRAFRDFYSADAISGRMDEFTARLRDATGQPIDRELEQRRAKRRARRNGQEG